MSSSHKPKRKTANSMTVKVPIQGITGGKRASSMNPESEDAPKAQMQRTEPEKLQKFLQRIGQPKCYKVLSSQKVGVTKVEQLRRFLQNRSQAEAEDKLEGYGISAMAATDIWNGLKIAADGTTTDDDTTETPRKQGNGSSNTSQGDPWANASDISAARDVITGTDLWRPDLTLEDLPLVGREPVFQQIDEYIGEIKSDTDSSERSLSVDKGQPILGTGATSGAGKSRLLQEFRRKQIGTGAGVITLTYNSLENLGPAPVERCNDENRVEKAFLSRLLCMMLPEKEVKKLGKSELWNQYNVTKSQVADLIAEKFAGNDVFILVDEVVNLSTKNQAEQYDDSALNKVVSVLGSLCHDVTEKLKAAGKYCIGFFTALSTTIIEKAQTVSNRQVNVVDLPLLTEEDTSSLIDLWTDKKGNRKLHQNVKRELFALTAGHARMLAAFLGSDYLAEWDTTTVEGIFLPIKKLCSIDPPSAQDIIAMLAQRLEDNSRLEDLCRRSLVQKLPGNRYLPVPAMLYHWATSNEGNTLGKDLKAFLTACWNRIFVDNRKQGLDGKPLEKVLSSYERLRRHWLSGEVQLSEFFKGAAEPEEYYRSKVKFEPLKVEKGLVRRKKNKWINFKPETLNNLSALYVQNDGGSRMEQDSDDEVEEGGCDNFPLYDWFTVVEVEGEKVPIGSQCKHGKGTVKDPDGDVISVKFSTLAAPPSEWLNRGWLVLNGEALREYLGPALTAAAVCVLLHPQGPKGP